MHNKVPITLTRIWRVRLSGSGCLSTFAPEMLSTLLVRCIECDGSPLKYIKLLFELYQIKSHVQVKLGGELLNHRLRLQ